MIVCMIGPSPVEILPCVSIFFFFYFYSLKVLVCTSVCGGTYAHAYGHTYMVHVEDLSLFPFTERTPQIKGAMGCNVSHANTFISLSCYDKGAQLHSIGNPITFSLSGQRATYTFCSIWSGSLTAHTLKGMGLFFVLAMYLWFTYELGIS